MTYIEAVIRPLCRERAQTLTIEADVPPHVIPLMDILRVNRIFFNLLSNAVKYTQSGGTILCRLKGEVSEEGRYSLRATVSDNGRGISEAFQKILFDPFTQEGRSDVSYDRGSGLGLAIVKRLLESMGGDIQVSSRVGEGTEFTLHAAFDCVPDTQRQSEGTAAPQTVDLTGCHILLCEDHPLNQEIARRMLSAKGAEVTVAEDGRQGVDLFAASPEGFYGAVLMDIRMPVMDGYAAAAAIRALSRGDARTVPIIALTADAFAEDVRKSTAAGMNAHVAKPVDPAVLFAVLKKMIAAQGDTELGRQFHHE